MTQNKKNKKYNQSNNRHPNKPGRFFNKHVKCEFEKMMLMRQ